MKKTFISVISTVVLIMTVGTTTAEAQKSSEYRFNHCMDDQITVRRDTMYPEILVVEITPRDIPPKEAQGWENLKIRWFSSIETEMLQFHFYDTCGVKISWQYDRNEQKNAQISLKGRVLAVIPGKQNWVYTVLLTKEQVLFLEEIGGFPSKPGTNVFMVENGK